MTAARIKRASNFTLQRAMGSRCSPLAAERNVRPREKPWHPVEKHELCEDKQMDLETFKATVPLLAVLLTAALSGYVVPRITRRWQDHQKELEIKTSLVEAISDEVLQFILAMQFAERR